MHLQQTKRGSRETGGPQYYFHDLPGVVKTYLRKKGAVQVALVTPYGATKSDYFAVSAHHKLDSRQKPVMGKVGHDRIQQGRATASIGESIRTWYNLPQGDFERIDIEIDIRHDDVFYLTPLTYKYTTSNQKKAIERIEKPLSFTRDYVSPLWNRQFNHVGKYNPGIISWALDEICRIVRVHTGDSKLPHVQEADVLRASGPLKHLGMRLGGYVGKGYDCVTEFSFLNYPVYTIPVELKRRSSGFEYQQRKYGKDELSRAIVLCVTHNHKQLPRHIDVIELEALCERAKNYR